MGATNRTKIEKENAIGAQFAPWFVLHFFSFFCNKKSKIILGFSKEVVLKRLEKYENAFIKK